MNIQDIQDALCQVYKLNADRNPADYLAACEYLIANRAELKERVYIALPGGHHAPHNPKWDNVVDGSVQYCGCGHERLILPTNLPSEYVASENVVLVGNEPVYLRSVGGTTRQSAYVRVESVDEGFLIELDPFDPNPNMMAMLMGQNRQGVTYDGILEGIAQSMAKFGNEPVMATPLGKSDTPAFLFAIRAADAAKQTTTIVLAEGIEVFDPETEANNCG